MALRPHPSVKAQDLLRSTAPAGMPGESRSLPGAFPRAAFNLALEPRIMFDAAGAATLWPIPPRMAMRKPARQ